MAKSLQEQLRQAGVASQKQVVKARKAQNTREKMQRKGAAVTDEAAELVKQRDEEIRSRDRLLNEEKNRALQQKALQAQIRQLIELNDIAERGDVAFKFNHDNVIKSLMVSEDMRRALVNGKLAIVGQPDKLSVVPAKVALKIAERDDSWLILLNDKNEQESDFDDEYAGYEVPDDLMW